MNTERWRVVSEQILTGFKKQLKKQRRYPLQKTSVMFVQTSNTKEVTLKITMGISQSRKSNDYTLLDTQEFNHEAKTTGNQALLVPLLTSSPLSFVKELLPKLSPGISTSGDPFIHSNKIKQPKVDSGALFVAQLGHILPPCLSKFCSPKPRPTKWSSYKGYHISNCI